MQTHSKRLFRVLQLMLTALLVFLTACASGQTSAPAPETSAPSAQNDVKASSGEAKGSGFPNKDITIVVPYSPGGGNDLMARLVGEYMEKNLPNDVKVVIENKPGGDSVIGLTAVYTAKPDGYTLGVAALPGNFVAQVLGGVEYDLTKVDYIGYTANTSYIAAASKKSGFTKLEDLQQAEEVIAGIGSISSTDGLGVLIAAEALGINVKTVSHKGSKEAILAGVRGDVDWVQFPVESMLPSVTNSSEMVPLWVYANERLPELPDVPTIVELGHKELLDPISLHRVMFSTPGTPEEALTVLRDAFQKAVNDPEYKAKVEGMKAVWNPNDHTHAEQVASSALKQLEPLKETLQKQKQ